MNVLKIESNIVTHLIYFRIEYSIFLFIESLKSIFEFLVSFIYNITNTKKNIDYILGNKPVLAICSRKDRICILCAGGN